MYVFIYLYCCVSMGYRLHFRVSALTLVVLVYLTYQGLSFVALKIRYGLSFEYLHLLFFLIFLS